MRISLEYLQAPITIMSLAQHLIQDLIDEMFMNKNICKKKQKT